METIMSMKENHVKELEAEKDKLGMRCDTLVEKLKNAGVEMPPEKSKEEQTNELLSQTLIVQYKFKLEKANAYIDKQIREIQEKD